MCDSIALHKINAHECITIQVGFDICSVIVLTALYDVYNYIISTT